MRSHIFGTLVGVLSQTVPTICLGVFEGFVGIYGTLGMQPPTSSDLKLLETGVLGFWNPRPPKKTKTMRYLFFEFVSLLHTIAHRYEFP